TDLDLGHYERFVNIETTQSSSLMSGRVLRQVIEDERAGAYLGKTVQIIPHVTQLMQEKIIEAGAGYDVHIVEMGGTVGDIESLAFLEAFRELGVRVGRSNALYVHVVYVPFLGASQEFKTKPAQNALKELRAAGIMPDIIAIRSEKPFGESVPLKISLLGGIDQRAIVCLPNAGTVYEVPLTLEKSGIGDLITERFGIAATKPNLKVWEDLVKSAKSSYDQKVAVAIVAKYLDNQDTYASVIEALKSAAWKNKTELEISWIDSEELIDKTEAEVAKELGAFDGILVPGGFGSRGLEGKIIAAQYALTQNKPYLGLCLGMQMAVIAAARKSGVKGATSFELDPESKEQVIVTMTDQTDKLGTGGTMRLGNYECKLAEGSLASKVYGGLNITERHRHRGECNPKYIGEYKTWGITASGINPDNGLVEIIEAMDHPFFLASQFHPEFKSRPVRPHPMFDSFIQACLK
ncbi:CTP synthase, partial [Candidatus Saccharibacteria bacterium]|nr:CTP synthase [Candidatus Saccharibacteria bacterium]